jgi:hypothetical protein
VENQAIARALRLGQKQSVYVVRYVVDQTVELVSRPRLTLNSQADKFQGNASIARQETRES